MKIYKFDSDRLADYLSLNINPSILFFLCLPFFILTGCCLLPACGYSSSASGDTCQLIVQLENSEGGISLVCSEVADSLDERALGLMYRMSLASDAGMFFIFEDETSVGFWMKNTYIPLDIIWIDKDRKILGISENTNPLDTTVIPPPGPYRYVLEVSAFYSRDHGLRVGDKVSW